jgi:redox-sensitive bicupin YhaK (pirin superfamily)
MTNKPTATVNAGRSVERIVSGQATQDGAGVKLIRVLSNDLHHRLDPFLMLDAFGSDKPGDYIAGFPDHPHRGFETITYMIAGRMRHRDSRGNEGLLQNGGVQWMTAGRGIIHSEMPEQEEGVMEGFQLWLNLPAKNKLCDPWYQDFQSEDIPETRTDENILVRVIAGNFNQQKGAVCREKTEPLYLDLHFPNEMGAIFERPLLQTSNAFIYVYRGCVDVVSKEETTVVPKQKMAILRNVGDGVVIRGEANARALLIAGTPLQEPIVQFGPFVMNTREEILEAVNDFRAGLMG